jgi:hypothetical protein
MKDNPSRMYGVNDSRPKKQIPNSGSIARP